MSSSARLASRVQVVPITRNVRSALPPSEAYITLNGDQRKAMAHQLSTISKLRLKDNIGRFSREDTAAIERAICLQLEL
jgi:mRNA-degrading endonuclease toxin of MazEF toxin-antitoxin module